jgi:hypothetical protein
MGDPSSKKEGKFDSDLGYKKPKNSGGKHNDANTFTLSDINNNEPVWSSHLDEDYGEVYFYNRITKKS